ncbi:serine hydrolase FSH [Amanita rubescens]|nr:serine hydrolase FSH [Amanita rubescens]
MGIVLALHGFTQNANIFSKRLGALRKECGKDVELVFVDAPMVLQPVDLDGLSAQHTTQQVLEGLRSVEASEDPASAPRAWWKSNKERTIFTGIEESIMMIRDVLKQRKFDGVLGFSQGAAFAAVIAALLERPHLYSPFLIDGEPPHPPLKFCIAISGYKPGGDICEQIFSPSYSTPTLHVLGKTDVVVVEERSRQLIEVSSGRRVEEHVGGHFVPSNGKWRKFLCAYMKNSGVDVPSPGSSASGTATPIEINSASQRC